MLCEPQPRLGGGREEDVVFPLVGGDGGAAALLLVVDGEHQVLDEGDVAVVGAVAEQRDGGRVDEVEAVLAVEQRGRFLVDEPAGREHGGGDGVGGQRTTRVVELGARAAFLGAADARRARPRAVHATVREQACGLGGAGDEAFAGDEQLRGLREDGGVDLHADFGGDVGEWALLDGGFGRWWMMLGDGHDGGFFFPR